MATLYLDLGQQLVMVDDVERRVPCHLVSEWGEAPGAAPPPPRPKRPRPAPAPSVKAIYSRLVGYGR